MSLRNLTCGVAAMALVLGAGLAAPAFAQDGETVAVERIVLPTNVVPERYEITIKPDVEAMSFTGQTAAMVEVKEATQTITLNAYQLVIDEAKIRGDNGPAATVSYDEEKQQATLDFGRTIRPGDYTLDLTYSGAINEQSEGLFVGRYTRDGEPKAMMVSQMEPGYARRVTPLWDEPSLKAVFETAMIVPEENGAVANMPVVSETSNGDGTKTVKFAPSPIMSSYLLFFTTGDIARVTGRVGDVETGTVVPAGDEAKGEYALTVLEDLLPWYGDYFGVHYALPKLDQIAVPGAGQFGAMENWGSILYFDNYLLLDPALSTEQDKQTVYVVVAHEVAHQWFGNLVTMAWWDDLWLNEGFASWMENKATNAIHPEWDMWLQTQSGQDFAMAQDSLIGTHAIVTPISSSETANFDGITYQKGQAVIRMLEDFVGEDDFRTGVQAYMAAHAYGNTVTSDLWSAVETASGEPIRAVADDFLTKPGVPLITVGESRCEGGQTVTALTQARFGADEASKAANLTWNTPVVARTVGGEPARVVIEGGSGSVTTAGCGPVKVNAGGAGYFRTLYPEAQREALEGAFADLDPADQLNLLYDAGALGGSDYQAVTEYLDLATRVDETADPVVQMQTADALLAMSRLYPDDGGEAFKGWVRGELDGKLQAVGWDAKDGEAPNVAILRNDLISVLSDLGDEATIAEARRRYAAGELAPGTRQAVINVVGQHADMATFQALMDHGLSADNSLEKRSYVLAAARADDPAMAQQIMLMGMTGQMDYALFMEAFNVIAGRQPDVLWSFLMTIEENIRAQDGADAVIEGMVDLVAMSDDPAARLAELQAYAAQHGVAETDENLVAAAERVASLERTRAERLPQIDAWVAAR